MTASDVLTLPQVAKRLGKSRNTIWCIAKRGDEIVPGVKAFKIGSQLHVSRIQLERFLAGVEVPDPEAVPA